MSRTFYMVLRLSNEMKFNGEVYTLPKGEYFFPMFDTKEAAQAYVAACGEDYRIQEVIERYELK